MNRYALTLSENGMVIGDGATAKKARQDVVLAMVAQVLSGKRIDLDDLLPSAIEAEYDADIQEARLDDGIVRLCNRTVKRILAE